jgi:hypothetical protein
MTIIKLLEDSLNNPLLLTFLTVWIVGWFIKNKTKIDNARIPLILTPLGILLGLFVIELSMKGAIVGLLIAAIQMGGYDLIKNLTEFIRFVFKSLTKDINKKEDIILPEENTSEENDSDILPPDNPI